LRFGIGIPKFEAFDEKEAERVNQQRLWNLCTKKISMLKYGIKLKRKPKYAIDIEDPDEEISELENVAAHFGTKYFWKNNSQHSFLSTDLYKEGSHIGLNKRS
jgi:hypothetical protein